MTFDQAFARTVGLEGAYSNNPVDRGGETMWGITAAVARAAGYQGSMAQLPLQTAKNIYRSKYWDLLHLNMVDKLSPAIAAEIFDTAVNCGVGVPIPFLQRALNAFNRQAKDYPDMPVDGLNGPTTVAALRAFLHLRGAMGEKVMLEALNAQQGVRYFEIAERRPDQEDFEFGWWAQRVAA
jgi:lysozyme family protein